MLIPLASAQFIASYACTNMNVAVSSIAKDLGTDVIGVQTARDPTSTDPNRRDRTERKSWQRQSMRTLQKQ